MGDLSWENQNWCRWELGPSLTDARTIEEIVEIHAHLAAILDEEEQTDEHFQPCPLNPDPTPSTD